MHQSNKTKLRFFTPGLLLFVLLFSTAQAMAVSLTDVDFKSLADGKTQIQMNFDGPAPTLSAYAVEDPSRLVLDLKQTDSKLAKKSYNVNHSNVNSALAIAAGGRVRFVVDMKQLKPYASSVNGNSLLVTIGDNQPASTRSAARPEQLQIAKNSNAVNRAKAASMNIANNSTSVPTQSLAGSDSAPGSAATDVIYNSVKDVRFERTAIGAGEVVIELASPSFQATSKRSGGAVIVQIPRASLSQSVPRVSNLTQFGTIIKSINNKSNSDQVVVQINAGADFEYEAYQIDNTYVVSMSPKRARQPTENLTPKGSRGTVPSYNEDEYTGERLSLNFQDIEIRSVLQLIADFTNLNLVVSDSVQGNITLRLKNVPWDQALAIILKAKGLDKRREGSVLMVAPADEIAARERKELEASQQLEALAPMMTEHIKIKYADAVEIFNIFLQRTRSGGSSGSSRSSNNDEKGTRGDTSTNEATASILSERGSVVVDERTNSLFVTETAERLANLKALIRKIDIPIRQVMIEARIVVANKSAAKGIGVRWGGRATDGNLAVSGGASPGVSPTPLTGVATTAAGMIADLAITGPTSGINIGYAIGSNQLINLQIQALEEAGNGEVISRPKVITGDKQEAVIESGTEVPFTTQGQDGVVTTEFKPVVLKLGVTPYITPDGRVIMDLDIIQDSVGELIPVVGGGVGGGSSLIPRIDTTKLKTQVLAGDGETVVLGGVFQENNTETRRKTPLLGDLPVVGSLFRSKSTETSKVETLIFITPKIIDEKLID